MWLIVVVSVDLAHDGEDRSCDEDDGKVVAVVVGPKIDDAADYWC